MTSRENDGLKRWISRTYLSVCEAYLNANILWDETRRARGRALAVGTYTDTWAFLISFADMGKSMRIADVYALSFLIFILMSNGLTFTLSR